MANKTVYPYGTGGQLPSSIGVINDLFTGGADKALSAQQGKEIGVLIGYEENVFEATQKYNVLPAYVAGSTPIMKAGKTYTIHLQADGALGQTKWELWVRTASGQTKIKDYGSADLSVEQTYEYTPAVDVYAVGSSYSSGVTNTSATITYTIPLGEYTTDIDKLNESVSSLSAAVDAMPSVEVFDMDNIVVLDATIPVETAVNSRSWYYYQDTPIMKAGKTYDILITASQSYTPTAWQLWVRKADGTVVNTSKDYGGSDLAEGVSKAYTPSFDVYGVCCSYRSGTVPSGTGITYHITTADKDSKRIADLEADAEKTNTELERSWINDFTRYYKLGAAKNDTYNICEKKIGIIVMGQSNAAGRIPNSSFPASATIDTANDLTLAKQIEHCQFMRGYNSDGSNTDSYDEATRTFSSRNNSGNWAFDDIVYNAINNALGGDTDFYALKQARGDTGIIYGSAPYFNPDIDQMTRKADGTVNSQLYHMKLLVERALELQPDINFKAVLWHQGEAENGMMRPGVYFEALSKVIYWMRGLIGNPRLPWIMGTVPTNSAQYNAIVKADMEKAAQEINDCYLIDLGSASDMLDQFHFGATTATYFGVEAYKIMRQNNMLAPMINPV